jgi:hypothetical protein
MTFNAAVPLNSDSPAIFPSQNQVNMARLQTLLGANHQFNLTAAADDGYHNLIVLTPQAPTGALAGLGRLYVRSSGGVMQLFYMTDAGTEIQITPDDLLNPIKVNGSQSLGAGASTTIFNVAYDFTGFGTVFRSGTNIQNTYNFMRSGAATDTNSIDTNGSGFPILSFSGTTLRVTNASSGTQTIVWSLMINRL